MIAGVLLLFYGYKHQHGVALAAGILLASAKPQSITLFMLIMGIYVLFTWPPKQWMRVAVIAACVVIPTFLWRGEIWLDAVQGTYQAGSIIDVSISAALNRTGVVPSAVIWFVWAIILFITLVFAWVTRFEMSREKAGMLIAAMLLLAPYAAGNSVLLALIIGIIPLFMVQPFVGGTLILLINVPFFWNTEMLFNYQSYWWTMILVSAWIVLGWRVYRVHDAPSAAPSAKTQAL